jgi:hypothetical protein
MPTWKQVDRLSAFATSASDDPSSGAERREDARGRRADQSETLHRLATGVRAARIVGVERIPGCVAVIVVHFE